MASLIQKAEIVIGGVTHATYLPCKKCKKVFQDFELERHMELCISCIALDEKKCDKCGKISNSEDLAWHLGTCGSCFSAEISSELPSMVATEDRHSGDLRFSDDLFVNCQEENTKKETEDTIASRIENDVADEFKGATDENERLDRIRELTELQKKEKELKKELNRLKNVRNHRRIAVNAKIHEQRETIRTKLAQIKIRVEEIEVETGTRKPKLEPRPKGL